MSDDSLNLPDVPAEPPLSEELPEAIIGEAHAPDSAADRLPIGSRLERIRLPGKEGRRAAGWRVFVAIASGYLTGEGATIDAALADTMPKHNPPNKTERSVFE